MASARGITLALSLLLASGGSWIGAAARGLGGGALGLATGLGVSTGVVVARARFENRYVESVHDLLGPDGVPIALGVVGGVAVGLAGAAPLAGAAAGVVAGGAVGAGVGAAVGVATTPDPEGTWTWGILLGAAGMLLGGGLGLALAWRRRGRRHRRQRYRGRSASGARAARGGTAGLAVALLAASSAMLALFACGGGQEAGASAASGPEGGEPAEGVGALSVPAQPAPAEAVIFIAGDPGQARYDRYPVLPRMTGDVSDWAGRVAPGREVVLMLGDIVYPTGMVEPGTPGFQQDSARVADQVRIVAGSVPARRDARMFFLAGNHDWGLREDQKGAKRLHNLGAFLDRRRAAGVPVELAPAAGTGGPRVVDVGDDLRLLLLDTAWWIFDAEPQGKRAFMERFRSALANAGDRTVIVAAHHPLETGGPHGGVVSLWSTLGVEYLLNRSGALLQDLSSIPYLALRKGMADAFREEGAPLVFVGGHDHSLQVIRDDSAGAPPYVVVSGSASKLSPVGAIPGTLFDASAPGYMRLVLRTDGSVDLYVEATSPEYQSCPDPAVNRQANLRCMRNAMAAFRTVYRARLRPPRR